MSIVKVSRSVLQLGDEDANISWQFKRNRKVPFNLGHVESMCIHNYEILTLYRLPRLQELGYVYH